MIAEAGRALEQFRCMMLAVVAQCARFSCSLSARFRRRPSSRTRCAMRMVFPAARLTGHAQGIVSRDARCAHNAQGFVKIFSVRCMRTWFLMRSAALPIWYAHAIFNAQRSSTHPACASSHPCATIFSHLCAGYMRNPMRNFAPVLEHLIIRNT